MSSSGASRTSSSRRRPLEFTNVPPLHASGGRTMRTIIGLLGVAALVLTGGPAGAQDAPCDFVTGGGDIIPNGGTAKANFGVGGSCKAGGDGRTLWGHLEYIDHGFSTPTVKKLNVHWT